MRRCLTLFAACLALAAVAAPAQAHRDARDDIRETDLAAAVRTAQEVAAAEPGDGLPLTWCGDQRSTDDVANAAFPASAAQFKVVYAHPLDQPSRFDGFKHALQANVALIGRFMSAQSGGLKAPRFDMGTSCGAQYVDIQHVTLPGPRTSYVDNFSAVRTAVDAQLNPSPGGPRHTFVLADTLSPDPAGWWTGVASRWDDDRPGAINSANDGGLFAVVWVPRLETPPATDPDGFWPEGMLHEMAHNLGAVQWSAPHTTYTPGGPTFYGHCWDEWDVMCYQDGPAPAHAMEYVCLDFPGAIGQEFDCGRDDYFNPAPPPGSYLATYWNIFDSDFLGPCAAIAPACGGTGPTTVPKPPVSTSEPQVSGTARQGEVLTTTDGAWLNSPTAISYQWQRALTQTFANVPGAVQATYTPGPDDVGKRLRVVVSAHNADGVAAVSSQPTAVVAGPPAGENQTPTGDGTGTQDTSTTGQDATQQVARTSTAPSSGRAKLTISTGRGRGRILGSVGFAVAAGRLTATPSRLRLAKGRYVLTVCTTAGGTQTRPRCGTRRMTVKRAGRTRVPVLTIGVPLGVDGRASVTLTAVRRLFAARTAPRPAVGVLLGG